MKRTKRKYTRKVMPEVSPLPPQGDSSGIEGKSNTTTPEGEIITVNKDDFSFKDLPLSLRRQIERIIEVRKRAGLPDDSKERKERAIKYFRGDRPR